MYKSSVSTPGARNTASRSQFLLALYFFGTTFAIQPPEDTTGESFDGTPSLVVFHLGDGTLADETYLFGVRRLTLRLACGANNTYVELWTAKLSTPKFTVDAYETNLVIASLQREDIDSVQKFEHLLKAVISLDASDEVRVYAKLLRVPLFEGEDALFWCVRHFVSLQSH